MFCRINPYGPWLNLSGAKWLRASSSSACYAPVAKQNHLAACSGAVHYCCTTKFVRHLCLRVEFLLKTESGYPRDAEVTLFTLANPEHSLRFNTHWSAPPVSALARSGGPRKVSQSPVSRNSNIETRMDRHRAVVGVIRGVA